MLSVIVVAVAIALAIAALVTQPDPARRPRSGGPASG